MRLIDADALIDDLMERYCKECGRRKGIKSGKCRIIYEIGEAPCRACEVDDVKAELEEAPTANVPDIKVGEWIRNDNGTYSCSLCQSWIPEEQHHYARYCLYCGARMERGEEE